MRTLLLASVIVLGSAAPALAADVLFVSDAGTDLNIVDALEADGHTVTSVTRDYVSIDESNPSLTRGLEAYDCVVWSASGNGFGGFHRAETFAYLTGYVDGGGRVLVTGVGSIGIGDRELITFLGGTGGTSFSGNPGPIAADENSLTTGRIDLRGVTPNAYEFQYEGLTGLSSDTSVVVMGFGSFGEPGAQWTLRGVGAGEIAYIANGSGTSTHPSWTATADGSPGAYNAAIRNFVGASGGSAGEPGAPTVSLMAPFNADEGAAITFSVEVMDPEGDAFTVSWDLDGDGTFGENVGMLSYAVPAGTTDDGTVVVGVEAVDAGRHRTEVVRRIRIANVAPSIVSRPPDAVSIGQNVQYRIGVADPGGARDVLSYELVRGPSSASLIDGVFRFVPTEGDVTPAGVAIDCEIAVTDDDGGRTSQVWRMTVANNYAPSDLFLEYPTDGIALLDRTPRLAVRDGSGIDGDPLQYFFELDTSEAFEAPLLRSGPVDEMPGFTTFSIEEPLAPGRYFWRAWLSDGTAETAPRVTSFWVLGPPEEPTDAGPIALPDAGGTVAARSCSAQAGTLPPPWGVLLFFGLVLAARKAVSPRLPRP